MTWLGSSPAMLVMVLAISANTPIGAEEHDEERDPDDHFLQSTDDLE